MYFFSLYSTKELAKISSIELKNKGNVDSPTLETGPLVYCFVCFDPRCCLGHMGFIRIEVSIFNPLYTKDIIRTAEMICSRCETFDSIEKIKGRKICSNCKDHARTYLFDPKKICLSNKKEPSHIISLTILKGMFNALLSD